MAWPPTVCVSLCHTHTQPMSVCLVSSGHGHDTPKCVTRSAVVLIASVCVCVCVFSSFVALHLSVPFKCAASPFLFIPIFPCPFPWTCITRKNRRQCHTCPCQPNSVLPRNYSHSLIHTPTQHPRPASHFWRPSPSSSLFPLRLFLEPYRKKKQQQQQHLFPNVISTSDTTHLTAPRPPILLLATYVPTSKVLAST